MPATCNARHKQRAKAEASGLVKIHGKHRQPKLKTTLATAQKAVGLLFPTFSIGYLTVNTRQVPVYSVRSLTGSGGGGGGGINGIYDLTDILDVSNCHKSERSRNKKDLSYFIVLLVIIGGLPGLV